MSRLRIGHLELFVADPMASLAFYRDILGFDVVDVQSDTFVWLSAGDLAILLRPAPSEGLVRAPDYERSGLAFVCYTDDLDGALARLAEAGLRPHGTDGSPRCPTFADPDGHWFQIVEPGAH